MTMGCARGDYVAEGEGCLTGVVRVGMTVGLLWDVYVITMGGARDCYGIAM